MFPCDNFIIFIEISQYFYPRLRGVAGIRTPYNQIAGGRGGGGGFLRPPHPQKHHALNKRARQGVEFFLGGGRAVVAAALVLRAPADPHGPPRTLTDTNFGLFFGPYPRLKWGISMRRKSDFFPPDGPSALGVRCTSNPLRGRAVWRKKIAFSAHGNRPF